MFNIWPAGFLCPSFLFSSYSVSDAEFTVYVSLKAEISDNFDNIRCAISFLVPSIGMNNKFAIRINWSKLSAITFNFASNSLSSNVKENPVKWHRFSRFYSLSVLKINECSSRIFFTFAVFSWIFT